GGVTGSGGVANKVDVAAWNPQTGALASRGFLQVADEVRGIAVDPTGRFLVTAHMFGAGIGIAVYAIDPQGQLLATPLAIDALPSTGRPAAPAFDRTGNFLYVRDLDQGIYAYRLAPTGAVSRLNGGSARTVSGSPSYVDLGTSRTVDQLYVLTAFTSTLTSFAIDAQGLLAQKATLALGDDCQHLALARTSGRVFCSSRAASRIHSVGVDPVT